MGHYSKKTMLHLAINLKPGKEGKKNSYECIIYAPSELAGDKDNMTMARTYYDSFFNKDCLCTLKCLESKKHPDDLVLEYEKDFVGIHFGIAVAGMVAMFTISGKKNYERFRSKVFESKDTYIAIH